MTAPLFVADVATVKAELRLTGVTVTDDAHVMIEGVLLTVRLKINQRLGLARVAELVAITYTANPATTPELLRAVANRLEILWTRILLMDVLPSVFMDNSGATQQSYNDEGAFRNLGVERLKEERVRALVQIEEWLCVLTVGCSDFGDALVGQVFTPLGVSPRPEPGDMAFVPEENEFFAPSGHWWPWGMQG